MPSSAPAPLPPLLLLPPNPSSSPVPLLLLLGFSPLPLHHPQSPLLPSSSTLLIFRTLGFTNTVLDGPGVADPAIDSLVSMAINLPFTSSCLLRICRSEPLSQLAFHDGQSLPGSPFLLLARYWLARIGALNFEVMAGLADDGVSLALLLQARNLLDLALLTGCLFFLVVPIVAPVVAVIGISSLGGTWPPAYQSPSLSPGESPPPLFDGRWTLHSGKALGNSGLPPPPTRLNFG
ncbi:hypothetical protein F5876DRAFT_83500 [Lentinula aff. lateritia]|uniref:Uncharacterized protein n=1 Tax=Lentinula aff. lateritia TaxID=2804960 RepID=A0ACC1THT0_9AGAR|nr:hypothetical protein F5876DRAFT_83500 [Lentinula aff. lateritia]